MTPALRFPVCLCVVALVGMTVGDAESQTTGGSGDGPSNPKARPAAAVAVWTQFEMNRKDADDRYLWTTPENWTKGLPSSDLCVEIGGDHSGKALHCVIPAGCDAVCRHFELAEHARTQGTTLRLEKGATLTTIQAPEVNFVDAVVLDVSSLKVPAGTYKVIDARSLKGTNLGFAEGTDTGKWSFRLEQSQGDLMLNFSL